MLKIRVANKKGYQEAYDGDGIDIRYPSSKTRRGRVQRGIAGTIQCDGMGGVVVEDKTKKRI